MNDIFSRVIFTDNDKKVVDAITSIPNLNNYLSNKENIAVFTELSSISSLQFETSSLPHDGPYFPNQPTLINLNIKDAGYF